jgi:hypothetical protein
MLVVSGLQKLQHGDLSDRQQDRIPGVRDVPAVLGEHGGVHRTFGPHVAGLGGPRHAAVPIPERIGEDVGEHAEEDHGGEDDRHDLNGGPGRAISRRAGRVGVHGSQPSEKDPQRSKDGDGGHRQDRGTVQRHRENMGQAIKAAGDPRDPQQIGVGEPASQRQGA